MKKQKILIIPIIFLASILASCSANSVNNQINSTAQTTISAGVTTYSNSGKIILNDETITITAAGEYEISGKISDGKIIVDAWSDAKVVLKFTGVDITNSSWEAVYIKSGKASIELVSGTENTLTDGLSYADTSDDAPNATLYAVEDLEISGDGKLVINANYNDALTTKDDLKIFSGNIIINAKDDAIRGKDSITIDGGNFEITSGGDAFKSDNENKWYITINGGDFTISAKSDGMQAYKTLTINGGKINILESEEWLEAEVVTIAGGDVNIISTDDGINASLSSSTTTTNAPTQADESLKIVISGGNLTINSQADGLDSNGNIEMTGGNVVVYGPENAGNGALDYDGNFTISGGNIIAFGSSGMAQNASANSSQNAVLIGLTNTYPANAKFFIKDNSGNIVYEAISLKKFQSVMISVVNLKAGETYSYGVNDENLGNFTISSTTTNIGNAWMQGGFGGGRMMNGTPPNGFSQNAQRPTRTPPNMQATQN